MDARLQPFFAEPPQGELVIGCYLWPGRFLVPEGPSDPIGAAAVFHSVQVDNFEVLLTGDGGLLVRPPADLPRIADEHLRLSIAAFSDKAEYEQKVAAAFNVIICELCLNGFVSEPAAPGFIAAGRLINGIGLIKSSKQATNGERNIARATALISAPHLLVGSLQYDPIDTTDFSVDRARMLTAISPTLPAFVAGAYFLYSRDQWAEAMVDGWVIIEQYVDNLWSEFLATLALDRRKRLSDPRSYSTAARLELLLTSGRVPESLYSSMSVARKHRNDLMHRGRVSYEAATDSSQALHSTLCAICGPDLYVPNVGRGINW